MNAVISLVVHALASLPTPQCAPLARSNAAVPPRALPRGVISVVDGFGADPSGTTDSTAALQTALTAAVHNNVTLFVPLGCYVVTKTLMAMQPRNGRWQPVVMVGELPTTVGGAPPSFVLPPSTPGFVDAAKPTPLLLFVTNWCLEPGLAEGVAAAGCADAGLPTGDWHSSAYQFNQALVGIDIFLGSGNSGSIGIDMNAAQGSTLENVAVYATDDALAGIAGGNGGGGSFKGITVVGAKYGIDMRETGDAATYVAITLLNQSCAAVLQGSHSTVIMTGFRIEGSPFMGGVVAGVTATELGFHHECETPAAPYEVLRGESFKGNAATALQSGASLVDSSIVIFGGHAPCVVANSSLYLSEVYLSGCAVRVASGGRPPLLAKPGNSRETTTTTTTHVELLGFGRGVPVQGNNWTYAFPAYINGVRKAEGVVRISEEDHQNDHASPVIPATLQSKHLWCGAGATWQSAGAVSAFDYGAKGDGVSDDYAALQAAVDAHDVVYLPKGFYRISKTLVLHRDNTALVGVGRTISFLMPLTTGLKLENDTVSADAPLLSVVGKSITVAFLTLATWDHLPHYALHWSSSSGDGIYRQVFFNRVAESVFPPFSAKEGAPHTIPAAKKGTTFARPLSIITGGGAFYDFNLDFGCCFGTVRPPWMTPPPDITSSAEILLQEPHYRTVLINGSTDGVRFYPLNAEQDFGEAHAEVRYSYNVTAYGSKSENNFVVLWIRDSDRIVVHGYGGNAAAFANDTKYRPGWIGGPTNYEQFFPSLFRVQRSTNVRFANLQGSERTNKKVSAFVAAGNGTDPREWNMVLQQDGEGRCDPIATPQGCSATRVLDRPVVWEWKWED